MIPAKGVKDPAQRKRTEGKKQPQTPIVGEKKQRGRKSKKVLE